jgi:hypothetical protein
MTAFERLLEAPWGPHDPEVAALSRLLRTGPVAGKLVLVSLAGGRCALARLPAVRFGAVERLGPEYRTVLEGERAVLQLRWDASR